MRLNYRRRLETVVLQHDSVTHFTRRDFFQRVSGVVPAAALTYLLGRDLRAAEVRPTDLKPRPLHFAAKATSIIHLFMNGGPSQMDLFDPKPMLDKHHGEPYFDKLAADLTTR